MIEVKKVANGYTVTKVYYFISERRRVYVAKNIKEVQRVVGEILEDHYQKETEGGK